MKNIVLFLLLLLSTIIYSQNLNLSNTVGFNFQDNSIKTYKFNVSSVNSYEIKYFIFSNTLNENITYSNKITQNEFDNKFMVNYYKNRNMLFLTNQINYSLSRNMNIENLIGGGYGRKDSICNVKINYSVGLLYDQINNQDIRYLRYSLRIKISQTFDKINWSIEYYYQPDILNNKNLNIYGTTKLNLKINNNLNLNLTDIYNFYSLTKVETIHTLTIGVNYNLSKNI